MTLPALAAVPAIALAVSTAAAQAPQVRIGGRIHTQFSTVAGDRTQVFDPATAASSAFEVRRLRIEADVRMGENANLVIQPSFEMGALRMRDAFLRVILAQDEDVSLGVVMGQEKKPFNRYELVSSNNLLSIERGGRFRGATGVAAQSNLLEENGYIAHDLGASVDLRARGGRLGLRAGVYNGTGESAPDVNDAKTWAARATWTALTDGARLPLLRLGAAFISRDRAVTTTGTSTAFSPDSSRRTNAWALDLEWGDFRPGLHVIADLATGDNVLPGAFRYATGRNAGNLRPNAPDSALATFRSFHAVAGWRFAGRRGRLVEMVEPALRLDLTDPNTAGDRDAGMLVTPAVTLYFNRTTLMRAGFDYYRYRDASGQSYSLRAFRVSWQSSF